MSDLIDRQALRKAMYHEAFEKDTDLQKWDSGCWIRYKMFERVVDSMPPVQPSQKYDSNTLEALDCVSRKAAIDAVRSYYDECDTSDKSIEERIGALPSAQQWIPCSERLPEVCDVYLVSGKMKYSHDKEWDYFVDVATNYGTYIDNYWDTSVDWDEGQEIHIIAWMPRPEPYRGGGEIGER